MAVGAPSNTLGLDFDNSQIPELGPEPLADALNTSDMVTSQITSDDPKLADDTKPSPELSLGDDQSKLDSNNVQLKEKKKPYVNLERVKTGGAQRVRFFFLFMHRKAQSTSRIS